MSIHAIQNPLYWNRNRAMNSAHQIQPSDKRKEVRHKCDALIDCSHFNRETHFEARLLNFSKGGVYLETDYDLKPGCTILLKLLRVSSSGLQSSENDYPRSVSLGEVKWRTDLIKGDRVYYGVGVRYPFPA